MRKIKVVVLLVRQLQHGFTKNAKVSPNLTVAHLGFRVPRLIVYARSQDATSAHTIGHRMPRLLVRSVAGGNDRLIVYHRSPAVTIDRTSVVGRFH